MEQKVFHFYISIHIPSVQPEFSSVPGCTPAVYNGKPTKWMVENSWGATSGHNGHLIMTDEWFDEYSFRLVVDKKYVPAATLELLKQKPTLLPAWDPLFAGEE